jgi:hypothetical protein
MFVRELTIQYYNTDLDLRRLNAIESRWHFISQKLNILPHNKWANLQVKGRWDKFGMDISALPSKIANKLEEATGRLSWPSEYFTKTLDLTSYKLSILSSSSAEEYTTVSMSPPSPPLRGIISGGDGAINPSPLARPRISARQRFQERRKQREMSRNLRTRNPEPSDSPPNNLCSEIYDNEEQP